MKAQTVSKTRNPLLKRDELALTVDADKTMSRKDLLEKLAAQLGVSADTLSLPAIHQQFGSKTMKVTARVYDSKEALQKTELPQIVFRNRGEKRKPVKKEKKKKGGKNAKAEKK
jgi:ribosomal protein S24E